MIIKKYQVFRYLRLLVLMSVLLFSFCKAQTLRNFKVKDGVHIKYEGFEKDEIYKNLYQLKFKILNDTNDTIFINENQIKLFCRDGKKKLRNGYSKFVKEMGSGQIIVIPKKLSELEVMNKMRYREIKEQFVDKYLKEHNIDESGYQLKKKQIIQQLIVVFPQESVEYKTLFYNQSLTQKTIRSLNCSCQFQ